MANRVINFSSSSSAIVPWTADRDVSIQFTYGVSGNGVWSFEPSATYAQLAAVTEVGASDKLVIWVTTFDLNVILRKGETIYYAPSSSPSKGQLWVNDISAENLA